MSNVVDRWTRKFELSKRASNEGKFQNFQDFFKVQNYKKKKISQSDMASSIHTFDENYQDTQDYNLSDQDIPDRDQILVVSFDF